MYIVKALKFDMSLILLYLTSTLSILSLRIAQYSVVELVGLPLISMCIGSSREKNVFKIINTF